MKYILSIIILLLLCSCDERVMTNNPVIIESIWNIDNTNQCIYTTHIINRKQEQFPINSSLSLYSEDLVSSKFQDICGKFQINDTIKLIAEKTTYINYGYDVDK